MDCPICHRETAGTDRHPARASHEKRRILCWRANPDAPPWAELDCERARAERAEQQRDSARETARVALAEADELRRQRDYQTALAARALERVRRTDAEAAALRAALQVARGAIEFSGRLSAGVLRAAIATIDVALASEAGRGYLPPADSPGAVAVWVADGWALEGAEVFTFLKPDGDPPEDKEEPRSEFCTAKLAKLWQVTGGGVEIEIEGDGWWADPHPSTVYLDRARCIRDAVRALDEERRGHVCVDSEVATSAASRTDDMLDRSEMERVISAADPNALLRAYQEVTRG